MNWLVFHIASGHAFFSGLLLLGIAAWTAVRPQCWTARAAPMLVVIGGMAIALSSTAIPYAAYALLAAAVVAWVAARIAGRWRLPIAAVLGGAVLLCGALEAPHHRHSAPRPIGLRTLAVIGDSVTAGLGEPGEVTWPAILERQHSVRIHDLSHVGETAASALKRVRLQPIESPLVLIEIGGNDLLGSTTATQFEADLNALLSHLQHPDRQLIMFELPLPPFYHEFGRIQREAAHRHNVILIPRRIFLGLLAGSDATLDSIHLSQAGHEQMAATVWRLVAPAYIDAAPGR